MPALHKTRYSGQIVWLGYNADRKNSLASTLVNKAYAGFDGFAEESHAGLTRASCSRVVSQFPVGTKIRNTRQFSICSVEELAKIAEIMGIHSLDPALLGVSILVSGIPDFSTIPPASRLQSRSGTTLCVDMQNRPCNLPAATINVEFPEKARAFKAAAKGLRGVTAWVERPGDLAIGDILTLHIPDQPSWSHTSAALQK